MEMAAIKENLYFSPEDQQFIDGAINFCQRMGERAVLMLVGSRAANFANCSKQTEGTGVGVRLD